MPKMSESAVEPRSVNRAQRLCKKTESIVAVFIPKGGNPVDGGSCCGEFGL